MGTSFSALAIVASLVAIAMIASGIYFYRDASSDIAHRKIVIATGSETGIYHALGDGLRHILENTGAFASIKNRATDGSEENIRLIGKADSNVDLSRQFEFIQRQRLKYGNDLDQGDDRDPLPGNNDKSSNMTIPANAWSEPGGQKTVTYPALPRFVDTRGGNYFFLPSISSVAGLAIGSFGKSGHCDA